MSIAVSAVVLPSRLLQVMVGVVCSGVIVIGIVIAFGSSEDIPLITRIFVAASCSFAAVFGFYHGSKHRKPIHIDISGTGQFRLTELGDAATCRQINRPHLNEREEVVRLLAYSTIWPRLLLLHLQDDTGKITILPILPDCVSRDAFRALSVACRWIAARGELQGREDA